MNNSDFSKSFKDTIPLVIDVTYNCNARCLYCQWGSDKTVDRIDQPDINILIPKMTLKSLGSNRIVFSGGEPLVRNDLERIISYYSKLDIKSIVVITNGLLLNQQRFNSLIRAGITGITFSIDGISDEIALNTRGFSKENCKKILDNLKNSLRYRYSKRLEVGINTVVSKANLDINVMSQLIEFCNKLEIDWIKFTPLFDDGFVSKNAPWLILQKDEAQQIRHIGNEIVRK